MDNSQYQAKLLFFLIAQIFLSMPLLGVQEKSLNTQNENEASQIQDASDEENDIQKNAGKFNCTYKECNNNKGLGYTSRPALDNHKLTIHAACPWCNKKEKFESLLELYEHAKKEHPQKPCNYCELCKNFITNHENGYTRHQKYCQTNLKKLSKKKSSTSDFNCFIKSCKNNLGKGFKDQSSLNGHTLRIHSACPWCDEQQKSDSVYQLYEHIEKKHSNEDCYFCKICKIFITNARGDYKTHKAYCKENPKKAPLNLLCSIKNCKKNKGKAFNDKRDLDSHVLKTHKICPWCKDEKIYPSTELLHKHTLEKHNDAACHLCELCKKYITTSKAHHNRHKASCKKKLVPTNNPTLNNVKSDNNDSNLNKKQLSKNKRSPEAKKDSPKSLPKKSANKHDKIRVFKTKPALDNHLLKVHISCPLCTTKSSYESHQELCDHVIAEHIGQSFYYCKFCEKFTTTDSRLYDKHQRRCNPDKNSEQEENKGHFNCPLTDCDNNNKKGFDNRNSFDNHMVFEHKICHLCEGKKKVTKFKTTLNLLNHIQKKHPEIKYYYCDTCKTFITRFYSGYRTHALECLKSKEPPLLLHCPIQDCDNNLGKGFLTEASLNNHLLSRHKLCSWCNDKKQFETSAKLYDHIITAHQHVHCYYCSICQTTELTDAELHKIHCNIPAFKKIPTAPENQVTQSTESSTLDTIDDSQQDCTFLKTQSSNHQDSAEIFECPWCTMAPFDIQEKFLEHIRINHPGSQLYYCQDCECAVTSFDEYLKRHDYNPDALPTTLSTMKCSAEYKPDQKSRNKIQDKLENKTCHFCNKVFLHKEELVAHYWNFHDKTWVHTCTCKFLTLEATIFHKHKQGGCKPWTFNKPKSLKPKTTPKKIKPIGINQEPASNKKLIQKFSLDNNNEKKNKAISSSQDNDKTKSGRYYSCDWCEEYTTSDFIKYEKHIKKCSHDDIVFSLNDATKKRNRRNKNQSLNHHKKRKISIDKPEKLDTQNKEEDFIPEKIAILHDEVAHVKSVDHEAIAEKNNTTQDHENLEPLDTKMVTLLPKILPHQGIKNESGSDCFINASLQILGNIPEFEKALSQKSYPENSIPGKLITFLNSLRTEENTLSGSNDLRKYIVENTDLEDLKNMGNGQHDAQEFLSILLSLFKDELKSVFEMEHESTLSCNTGCYNNQTVDPSWLLSLEIPPQRKDCSLELNVLIKNFFGKTETINDFSCISCHQRGAQRTITPAKFPPVLVIAPKRFEYDQQKNTPTRMNTPISTEEKIFLTDKNQTVTYQLIGVITHTGNITRGHCIACVKDSSNNTWYEYNDSVRTKISIDTVTQASKNPYIYFYRCTDKKDKTDPQKPLPITSTNPAYPDIQMQDDNSLPETEVTSSLPYASFFDEPGMIDEQNKKFVNYAPDEENQNLEEPSSQNYRCGQYPTCTLCI
jgi:hypothetical protein